MEQSEHKLQCELTLSDEQREESKGLGLIPRSLTCWQAGASVPYRIIILTKKGANMKRNILIGFIIIGGGMLATGIAIKSNSNISAKHDTNFPLKAQVEKQYVSDDTITDGKNVKMHYVMKVDGAIVLDTHQGKPAEIAFGTDRLLRGIQAGIEGLKAGDQKQLILAPEDAFGPVNPQAVQEFRQNQIVGENSQEQNPVDLQVGMVLDSQDQDGQRLRAVITEVREETVFLDFNHPLAGKELRFEVEILEVM